MGKILDQRRPDSMTGYIQAADVTRYRAAVAFGGRTCERYEVWHHAYWQESATSSDARAFRERMEYRSETPDQLGQTVSYRYYVGTPSDYAYMTPKQVLGQYFDGANSRPVWFFRFENQTMTLLLNSYVSSLPKDRGTRPVPSWKLGELNLVEIEMIPRSGVNQFYMKVLVNGATVVDENLTMLPANTSDLHFKYGIYRSDMDDWQAANPGKIAPTQNVYYSGVRRIVGPVRNPDVPTEPNPEPNTPEPETPVSGNDAEERALARSLVVGLHNNAYDLTRLLAKHWPDEAALAVGIRRQAWTLKDQMASTDQGRD